MKGLLPRPPSCFSLAELLISRGKVVRVPRLARDDKEHPVKLPIRLLCYNHPEISVDPFGLGMARDDLNELGTAQLRAGVGADDPILNVCAHPKPPENYRNDAGTDSITVIERFSGETVARSIDSSYPTVADRAGGRTQRLMVIDSSLATAAFTLEEMS